MRTPDSMNHKRWTDPAGLVWAVAPNGSGGFTLFQQHTRPTKRRKWLVVDELETEASAMQRAEQRAGWELFYPDKGARRADTVQ